MKRTVEHSKDFVMPTFTRNELMQQADKMTKENTISIFETA